MDVLLELAGRCEAATGPDGGLDRQIADALGFRVVNGMGQNVFTHNSPRGSFSPRRYTASLDAALTLLPTDPEIDGPMIWALDTNTFIGCDASIYTADTDGPPQIQVEAATPALALCAAVLRATARLEDAN